MGAHSESSPPSPRAVKFPIVFTDTETKRVGYNFDHRRSLKVLGSWEDSRAQDDGVEQYVPGRLLMLSGLDTSISPVCVLSRCEVTDGCSVYDTMSSKSLNLRHGSSCGPGNGGEFYIRDGASGFPPRSA